MIPAPLSSDTMDTASPGLSDLLLVLRSEEVLADPGAPSFAAGFNPTIRHRLCPRGGRLHLETGQVLLVLSKTASEKIYALRQRYCKNISAHPEFDASYYT